MSRLLRRASDHPMASVCPLSSVSSSHPCPVRSTDPLSLQEWLHALVFVGISLRLRSKISLHCAMKISRRFILEDLHNIQLEGLEGTVMKNEGGSPSCCLGWPQTPGLRDLLASGSGTAVTARRSEWHSQSKHCFLARGSV